MPTNSTLRKSIRARQPGALAPHVNYLRRLAAAEARERVLRPARNAGSPVSRSLMAAVRVDHQSVASTGLLVMGSQPAIAARANGSVVGK